MACLDGIQKPTPEELADANTIDCCNEHPNNPEQWVLLFPSTDSETPSGWVLNSWEGVQDYTGAVRCGVMTDPGVVATDTEDYVPPTFGYNLDDAIYLPEPSGLPLLLIIAVLAFIKRGKS